MRNEKNLIFIPARNGKPAHYLTDVTLNYRRVRRFAGYTKEEAKIYLAKLRIAAREGKLDELIRPQTPSDTFGEYARALLDSAEWNSKRSASRNEISYKHLNRAFKDTRLAEINAGLVRKYMTGRRDDGMSSGTINRELSFLKSVLYAAEYDGLIASNPIRGRRVKKLEEIGSREKTILGMNLSDDDLQRLVDCAADYLKPILKLALITGMRQGEILKMKWKDLKIHLGTIQIPSENAKSKKERLVPIDRILGLELDSLPRNSEYIFFNPETGTRRKEVREAFRRACEAAEIMTGRGQGLVFHDLRHIAAYRLIKVTDVVTASKILGHSSLDITLRYVHPTAKDKHEAVEKAAENLFQGRQKDVNAQKLTSSETVENMIQIN